MTQVKDPVCGMNVAPERAAAKGTYGTETVYFCSEGCKETYESRRGADGPSAGPAHPM